MELTDAMPFGETRGSIRALTKLAASIRQPALALCVNETARSARVERSVGAMVTLAVARKGSGYCQSRTLGTLIQTFEKPTGTCLGKGTFTASK